jgi:DNA-binding protein
VSLSVKPIDIIPSFQRRKPFNSGMKPSILIGQKFNMDKVLRVEITHIISNGTDSLCLTLPLNSLKGAVEEILFRVREEFSNNPHIDEIEVKAYTLDEDGSTSKPSSVDLMDYDSAWELESAISFAIGHFFI